MTMNLPLGFSCAEYTCWSSALFSWTVSSLCLLEDIIFYFVPSVFSWSISFSLHCCFNMVTGIIKLILHMPRESLV